MRALHLIFITILSVLLCNCGDITIETPETEDTEIDLSPNGPDTTEDTDDTEIEEEDTTETPTTSNVPNPQSYDTVCQTAIPAGMMDLAIQKSGHFYETAAKIMLHGRTSLSPDQETGERFMYGDSMRMWVHVPEIIRPISGRGSSEVEICLTVGNVNCRYIWGAKVFELDFCDFGVQPNDVLGARYFSLEVHNSDLAPDVEVRAALEAVSPVR